VLRKLALLLAAHSRATPKQAKEPIVQLRLYYQLRYETDYEKNFSVNSDIFMFRHLRETRE
jgi:hypothetical protein